LVNPSRIAKESAQEVMFESEKNAFSTILEKVKAFGMAVDESG
jgi:hypothetical protein